MDRLRPYSDYKDSDLAWLGKVPAHWQVARTKRHFRLRAEKSSTNHGLELLSIYTHIGVRPRRELEQKGNKASTTDGYWVVRQGDIIVNKLLAWMGAIGVSHYDGVTSPAYDIVMPVSDEVDSDYCHYLFRTAAYLQQFKSRSRGIMDMRLRLYYDQLGQVPLLLPPRAEQKAIVRFLNAHHRLVNRLIANRRRVIDVLNEQKQAIINEAVLRPDDACSVLGHSGNGSQREIPGTWKHTRLKYVADVQTGITLGKRYGLNAIRQYPYLRVANVQAGHLDLSLVKDIAIPESEATNSMLQYGDVLMTEGGDIDKLGRGCVWRNEITECLHQNHVFAVRCRGPLQPNYLVALMSSSLGRAYFQSTAKQTTNLASTNSGTLRAFPLCLPSVDEQREMLSWVNDRTVHLDLALDAARREIDLVREYQMRLVPDVVTGKLDVRHLAPPAASVEPEELMAFDADEAFDELQIGDNAELNEELTDA